MPSINEQPTDGVGSNDHVITGKICITFELAGHQNSSSKLHRPVIPLNNMSGCQQEALQNIGFTRVCDVYMHHTMLFELLASLFCALARDLAAASRADACSGVKKRFIPLIKGTPVKSALTSD